MGNNNLIIKLRNVAFKYPGQEHILEDVSLDFSAGERVGFIGHNGSGKTTLFHLIMGLLRPDSGSIEIFGTPRTTETDFKGVRSRIGLMFQDADDQLFCPTVEEDVAFGPLNLGKTREEALDLVEQSLEKVGLKGFRERITYKLSGGEKKMVALATVLAMEPEVLLLDEPFTGLDRSASERIADVITQSGLSYILISHDQEFLDRTVNRYYELKSGTIHHV